jgi:hypothetical protein
MSQNGGASGLQEADNARAFLDYFCCPHEFAPFGLTGERTAPAAFFTFGSSQCYGRTTPGPHSNNGIEAWIQAAKDAGALGKKIPLFFSPTEVVENLRRERYLTTANSQRRLRNLYYFLRPVLPFGIRKLLQQSVFRWRNRSFPCWPVDCSVEQILELLMELAIHATGASEIPFIWFWPEGNNCAGMMTHDVEEENGAAYCDTLMDVDDSLGIKAAFQLVPEGRYGGVESLVARIRARGFEANIHDLDHDGRLYDHAEQFQQRARKINEYARKYGMEGFRAGAMHRNQEWFGMLEFQYEMSVPTVSHLEPQSGGCCTVTPYFVGNVLELPLTTVQDHGLFYILDEQSIDLWKQQIEIISAHHGLISFIIHPDYIIQTKERELYCDLLRHLRSLKGERDIWFAVPSEINRWWRERSRMQLMREQRGWRIEGPGRERARLAYARIVNGKLSYRLADESSASWRAEGISERESPSPTHI